VAMKTGVVLVAVLTLAARAAGANTAPSLSVAGGVVAPGDRIVVHVHGAAPNRRLRV